MKSPCTNARRFLLAGIGLAALATLPLRAAGPRLRVLEFDGAALEGNPLHDPSVRRVAVFTPRQDDGSALPVVYYLPGWDDSCESFIQSPRSWLALVQRLADKITPMRLVVVDGRTRWGGSQYLNSPAQGNYADYFCRDVASLVESSYPAPSHGIRRILAGHSSGGFGALRLGMAAHELFDGVVALSPDSDFPVSHLHLVQVPSCSGAPAALIERYEEGRGQPSDGDLAYAIGLSAAYAPAGPGRFDWLYNSKGAFRQDAWNRWLANDPLTIVRQNPSAFSPRQRIYLDGASRDEFQANIGARAIYQALKSQGAACAFDEPPGHHGDHVDKRLEKGIAWVFSPQPR